MSQDMAKVWVAYHHDYSEFAVFLHELPCRRYAMDHGMDADEFDVGRGIQDQARERWKARAAEARFQGAGDA